MAQDRRWSVGDHGLGSCERQLAHGFRVVLGDGRRGGSQVQDALRQWPEPAPGFMASVGVIGLGVMGELLDRDFTPEASINDVHKDIGVICEEARHAGIHTPIASAKPPGCGGRARPG